MNIRAVLCALFLLGAVQVADANPHHGHHFHHGVGKTHVAWGWFPGVWVGVYPGVGFSYWPYFGYAPYYASFGAIAYSPSTQEVGFSYGQVTRERAAWIANRYCGVADCQTVVWVQGGCAALAASEGREKIAYAYAASRWEAERRAQRTCEVQTKAPCQTLAWTCSG